MHNKKFSGYLLVVGAATLAGLFFAYFKGEQYDPSVPHRITAVLLIGAVLLLLRPLCKVSVLFIARHAPGRMQFKRDPAARNSMDTPEEFDPLKLRLAELKYTLKEQQGCRWRWRYRDRWLLLSGAAEAIDQLAPHLRRDGWVVTRDAVLLYDGKTGDSRAGRDVPDSAWLRQICRLRKRRPVDAVVVVVQSGADDGTADDDGVLAHQLYLQQCALGWAAPCYVLHVGEVAGAPSNAAETIGCTWSGRVADAQPLGAMLADLSQRLAERGVGHLARQSQQPFLAQLSRTVESSRGALVSLVERLGKSRALGSAVHGVLFAPLFKRTGDIASAVANSGHAVPASSTWSDANWQAIGSHSRRARGRRIGFSAPIVAAWGVVALLAICASGILMSGAANRAELANAVGVVDRLRSQPTPVVAALGLDALQKQIDTLEVRQRDGAPWHTRFGLNRNGPLLDALWPRYQAASRRILSAPLQLQLETDLQERTSLPDQELADGGDAQVKLAYAALKSYLMLAQPRHADPAFLAAQWQASGLPAMPSQSQISAGGWRDLSRRLIAFHTGHLAAHPAWAITPDAALVASARQSLAAVIGLQNSTDVQYQAILDDNAGKYPPLSLQALLGNSNSRGLFGTEATVPGVFTRAAWDERIAKAIDDADRQRHADRDWVLAEGAAAGPEASAGEVTAALRSRYFADYARAWEGFLNSIQWQDDATLSGTIDQLTLLADAQRSPLSALFKAIGYQAGAGTSVKSLGDNLLSKARQLVNDHDPDPSKAAAPAPDAAPLAAAFGPLLRLDNSGVAANAASDRAATVSSTDMSLARYLERVTAVRLKLQQIMQSGDPDVMSRTTAQAILQGKTSDLADSRDYASRVGASLGAQWAGFGGAVFGRPLEQTWGVVLRPAAANINALWRSAIVRAWDGSFGDRYPFVDTDNDASLPELARFLRRDGLIPQFVATQLAGLLERQGDQWVPTQGTSSAPTLAPEFIDGLNHLTRISNRLFSQGDAKIRFELKPVATGGVTDMRLRSGAQELHYFNQREKWQPMVWPGEALAGESHLEWSTDKAGLRADLHADGRFGLIRLLSQAQVAQIDGAQYLLTWKAAGEAGVALRMLMRSEAGGGPLDVLALRQFTLPQQIFSTPRVKADVKARVMAADGRVKIKEH